MSILILSPHDEGLWYDPELRSILEEIFDPGCSKDSAYCMGLCNIALAVVPHENKGLRSKLILLRDSLAKIPNSLKAENVYYKILDRRNGEVMPVESANSAMRRGIELQDSACGNLEKVDGAIELYLHALSCLNITEYKYDWANIMIARARIVMHLGNAYLDLARSRAADGTDIDQAIMNYRIALAVFSREMTPIDWAIAIKNLEAACTIRAQYTCA